MVSALHYVDFSIKVQASIPRRASQNGAMSLRLHVALTAVMHSALSPQPAPGRPALPSRALPAPRLLSLAVGPPGGRCREQT